jgi:hypothetical protein
VSVTSDDGMRKPSANGLAAPPRRAASRLLPPEVREHDAENSYQGDRDENARRSK